MGKAFKRRTGSAVECRERGPSIASERLQARRRIANRSDQLIMGISAIEFENFKPLHAGSHEGCRLAGSGNRGNHKVDIEAATVGVEKESCAHGKPAAPVGWHDRCKHEQTTAHGSTQHFDITGRLFNRDY